MSNLPLAVQAIHLLTHDNDNSPPEQPPSGEPLAYVVYHSFPEDTGPYTAQTAIAGLEAGDMLVVNYDDVAPKARGVFLVNTPMGPTLWQMPATPADISGKQILGRIAGVFVPRRQGS